MDEPYCEDHSFTGTSWYWDEKLEQYVCVRCKQESKQLDEADL